MGLGSCRHAAGLEPYICLAVAPNPEPQGIPSIHRPLTSNGSMTPSPSLNRRARLRAPKAAAIAGIVFSILLIASLVITLSALPPHQGDEVASFAADQTILLLAFNLVPFAGIAFLWFIGVVRDLLGAREDQFFATVFFGSGLLFLAMLFVSTAVAGSVLLLPVGPSNSPSTSIYYNFGRTVSREILSNYGIRMAGVFMLSTSTLFLRTRVIPRWMAWLGYGLAIIMLLRIGHIERLGWVFLGFPLWVLLISVYILVTNYHKQSESPPEVG